MPLTLQQIYDYIYIYIDVYCIWFKAPGLTEASLICNANHHQASRVLGGWVWRCGAGFLVLSAALA